MSHGCYRSGYSSDESDMNAESEMNQYSVAIKNRFDMNHGRGNDWEMAGARRKRKKFSTDSINSECFTQLSHDDKLICLFNNLKRNFETLSVVERNQNRCFDDIKRVNQRVHNACKRTEGVEQSIDVHALKLKMLSYKSIDLEARSRRNNLIFWGLTERSQFDCKNLILNFISDELDIDTSNMCIERAHRLGSLNQEMYRGKYDAKRPIIIRLRDYADTEIILEHAYILKGSQFGMDRDYPKEIADARKSLYKSEKAKNARYQRQKIQIKYPAKLIIAGKVEDDRFPDWYDIMREGRVAGFEPKDDNKRYDLFPNHDRSGVNIYNKTYSRSTIVGDTDDDEHQDVFSSNQVRTNLFSTNKQDTGNAHSNVNKTHVIEGGVSRDKSNGVNPRESRGNNTCVNKTDGKIDSPLSMQSTSSLNPNSVNPIITKTPISTVNSTQAETIPRKTVRTITRSTSKARSRSVSGSKYNGHVRSVL